MVEQQARLVRGILYTDSRGGFDAVERNESPFLGLSNLRAALQASQLRDSLQRVGSELRWLASDYDKEEGRLPRWPGDLHEDWEAAHPLRPGVQLLPPQQEERTHRQQEVTGHHKAKNATTRRKTKTWLMTNHRYMTQPYMT